LQQNFKIMKEGRIENPGGGQEANDDLELDPGKFDEAAFGTPLPEKELDLGDPNEVWEVENKPYGESSTLDAKIGDTHGRIEKLRSEIKRKKDELIEELFEEGIIDKRKRWESVLSAYNDKRRREELTPKQKQEILFIVAKEPEVILKMMKIHEKLNENKSEEE